MRAVSDPSNKTLGFGIFYAMVNIGGTFGPIVAGHLRAISWSYAFVAAAIAVVVMLLVTIFFYKEPPRLIEGTTLKQKFGEMGVALSDVKFTTFLALLGFFWWLPFWSFFNICAVYVDSNLDTARLYLNIKSVLGSGVANFLSHEDESGVRRILGETIGSTGWIIIVPPGRACRTRSSDGARCRPSSPGCSSPRSASPSSVWPWWRRRPWRSWGSSSSPWAK